MRILFLDDNEDRHKKFKQNSIGFSVDHVYTAQEAIGKLSENDYDLIYLDHDLDHKTENELNEDEEDGRFVARQLAKMEKHLNSTVVIHSLNRSGGIIMKGILEDSGFLNVLHLPFAWTKQIAKKGNGIIINL